MSLGLVAYASSDDSDADEAETTEALNDSNTQKKILELEQNRNDNVEIGQAADVESVQGSSSQAAGGHISDSDSDSGETASDDDINEKLKGTHNFNRLRTGPDYPFLWGHPVVPIYGDISKNSNIAAYGKGANIAFLV